MRAAGLPGTFDAEGGEVFGFAIVEEMLDDAIDAASAGAAMEAVSQLDEIRFVAGCDDFYIAILSVAHPAAQLELAGFALHEPAEANALYPSLNQKVKNHGRKPWPVLQRRTPARNRSARAGLCFAGVS